MNPFLESPLESPALVRLAGRSIPGVHGDTFAPSGDRPIHRAFARDQQSGAKLELCGGYAAMPVVAHAIQLYRSLSPRSLSLILDSVSLYQFGRLMLIEKLSKVAPPKRCGALA